MKVEVLKPKAYCAGVANAIKIALKAREENPDKNVYVLGMLVHNNFVVQYLEHNDIHTTLSIDEIPNGSVIIFSAHGHIKEFDEVAKEKKLKVYDAICPKVLHNINLIEENLKQDHQIIYIGQKGHPEAEACLSLSKKVILYSKNLLRNYQSIYDESPLVINQTTLNILDLKGIHKALLKAFPNTRIVDEICNSTRLRQEAILSLKKDVDLIIVVGDINSSNSNRLIELAIKKYPYADCIMISDEKELTPDLFKNKNHIVISSGASTPEEIIDAVYDKIVNY